MKKIEITDKVDYESMIDLLAFANCVCGEQRNLFDEETNGPCPRCGHHYTIEVDIHVYELIEEDKI